MKQQKKEGMIYIISSCAAPPKMSERGEDLGRGENNTTMRNERPSPPSRRRMVQRDGRDFFRRAGKGVSHGVANFGGERPSLLLPHLRVVAVRSSLANSIL